MHRTRQAMPKTWILRKKGAKYIAANGNAKALPVFTIMRDLLKIAKDRSEVKKIIKESEVKVNNKKIEDNKFLVRLNDIIEINKKHYVLMLGENKKLGLNKIENNEKITLRVINKKLRKENKVQINCNNGKNYLVNDKEAEKIKTGYSVIIDLKSNKIVNILPLKEGENVLIINGKHIGKKGIITRLDMEKKVAEIKSKHEKINVMFNYLMVEK